MPPAAKKKDPPPDHTVMVKLPAPPKLKQIQGDERIFHALDRLTFGPRPGEVEEVKAIGLDAWIAQQLHPASIDDTAMETAAATISRHAPERRGSDPEIPSRQHHSPG